MKKDNIEVTDWLIKGISPKKLEKEKKRVAKQTEKQLNRFHCFYKPRKIYYKIDNELYYVNYYRTPFWTYEKPTLKLFIKEKLCWWHAQVWEVLPGGGGIGLGTWITKALFPRKRMKEFLKAEAEHVYKICHKEEDNN